MALVWTINNLSQWAGINKLVIERWHKDSSPFRVTLDTPKRNTDQNALFHSICQQCADKVTAASDDPDYKLWSSSKEERYESANWWKNELKNKLGLKEVHFDMDDQPTVLVVSTTKYSKPEMAAFIDKIVAYMDTQFNIAIEIKDKDKP